MTPRMLSCDVDHSSNSADIFAFFSFLFSWMGAITAERGAKHAATLLLPFRFPQMRRRHACGGDRRDHGMNSRTGVPALQSRHCSNGLGEVLRPRYPGFNFLLLFIRKSLVPQKALLELATDIMLRTLSLNR